MFLPEGPCGQDRPEQATLTLVLGPVQKGMYSALWERDDGHPASQAVSGKDNWNRGFLRCFEQYVEISQGTAGKREKGIDVFRRERTMIKKPERETHC